MNGFAFTANGFEAARASKPHPWLRGARWDLTFVILSVVVAFVPYSVYVVLGGDALHSASVKGTTAYDARVTVNLLVALLLGGPHMYATFTRTLMDPDFRRKRPFFLISSVLVPVFVVVMATASYESYVWLLSIFFVVASIHALHQLVWLSEAYSRKAKAARSLYSRVVDYGVVLTSLYPIAVYRMVEGDFKIGPMELKYTQVIGGWWWLAYLAFAVFFVMLALFITKTVREYQLDCFNLPKTLLISITVTLMFWTPAFPNLDTAFQGVNAWHSFQYLALTWYANRLREQRSGRRIGFLHLIQDAWQRAQERGGGAGQGTVVWARRVWLSVTGGLRHVDRDTGWSTFYLLCMAMLPISGMLILSARFFWPSVHGDLPGADEAYTYMGILSVLLVHYVHDAVLFTDESAIVEGAQASTPKVATA